MNCPERRRLAPQRNASHGGNIWAAMKCSGRNLYLLGSLFGGVGSIGASRRELRPTRAASPVTLIHGGYVSKRKKPPRAGGQEAEPDPPPDGTPTAVAPELKEALRYAGLQRRLSAALVAESVRRGGNETE